MHSNWTIKDWVWHSLILFLGLIVMAFGVAFSIKADLGTSPISSVPYTISQFSSLTVGQATIAMHCVFIALQILILRKKYHPFQLLQLPAAIIFGYMTDFALWVLRSISCNSYPEHWIICGIGIGVVAIGVTLEVLSDIVTLAGEGLSLAICQVTSIRFGNMKVIFDVTLVITACILGLVFTGHIQGVREGTVAAAIFVGMLTRLFMRFYYKQLKQIPTSDKGKSM